MEVGDYFLDLILVPLSISLTAGYHAYVYRSLSAGRRRPLAAVKIAVLRRAWFSTVVKDDSKKGMLGVQSLRNSLMVAILSATMAIVLNTALAALCNNALKAAALLRHARAFGGQSGTLLVHKYAVASLMLMLSFLCSSAASGCMIEGGFQVNGVAAGSGGEPVLLVSASMLTWLLGSVPLVVSSAALVLMLYQIDFPVVVPPEIQMLESDYP
ncbi:unnamed protein product [Spirodela intermedia]|uniref:Uncharacterized protein n=1 Tax=Spirodela intermedia TaxID=51605 RepID=A0A7I8IXJ7_SPIIN|nr:unnamed protein product [Spirodela intermedia]CAA6661882.1 unnamed protein product [Spirodela intermedia]